MNTISTILLTTSLLLLSGCGEDFLEKTDPNSLAIGPVFSTYETSVQAVNGVYTPLKEVDLWGDEIHFFLHQVTDEYGLLYDGFDRWNQMKNFSQTPDNETITAVWRGLSKIILRANAVIEGTDAEGGAPDFTGEQRDQLRGQAYFLRGYAFFLGVSIFGEQPAAVDSSARGFPLITTVPERREATLVGRASVAEVYTQVIRDLERAEALLPPFWSGEDVGRATQGAASGLLGKVYLYREAWARATVYFEKLIDNPQYELLKNFADNFNGVAENGSEAIFEVQYSGESPTLSFNGGPGHVYATRHAPAELDAFGNVSVPTTTYERIREDPRVTATVIRPGDYLPFIDTVYVGRSPTDYRPRKFIDTRIGQINSSSGATFNGSINMPLMRLADVYLMYAEAQNELGNTAVALEYLNKVRRRAYGEPTDAPSALADVPVGDVAALRRAIQEERYVELLGEGHRWFDLLRWGLADDALGSRGFQVGKSEAMPIPLDEIQLNTVMQQNNGY